MITRIEQMEHPLGIRFYKLHVDDFVSGHVWCIAYKYHGCLVSSYALSFTECARVCYKIFGISLHWSDCSDLVNTPSSKGYDLPRTYSQFTEWLNAMRPSFKNI